MHDAIQISKINDFLFCPNSIYLHAIYESFTDSTYKQKPQVVGKLHHENIDKAQYSSSTRYLQGIPVFTTKYSLIGKIDIYDVKEKALIERKYKINKIYDGHKYQLYAQYFAMKEKDYEVSSLYVHSLSDNKRYEIDLPDRFETAKFEEVIRQIRDFYTNSSHCAVSSAKCSNCIYNTLCHYA